MSAYAQPHEGVTGIDRAGDPLMSVEGTLVAAELTGMLFSAVLVGNPAPKVREMYERMNTPVSGDAVVVHDSIFGSEEQKIRGVGYLVLSRREWADTDVEWAKLREEDDSLAGDDRYVDEAWYIQYGPMPVDVCRWSNCMVLAIPRTDTR